MAKLVILVGLPGAGKSDYREQDGKDLNAVEIGTDDIRLEFWHYLHLRFWNYV
jgi:predicted kinase